MNNLHKKKIFICATEQSGDNIGYNLIKKIIKNFPDCSFDGVGGNKMQEYLQNKYFGIEDFKSIGIFEIIFSLKKYINMISYLSNKIIFNDYDLIITIDSPDFNYPLVNKLRKLNYNKSAIHVVAPTVWAWRKYRAKKFSRIYDEMFLLFSFEKYFFSKFNLKTTVIGHPIYYIKSSEEFSEKNNIAFLPGSRVREVNSLMPYFEIAYQYLNNQKSHLDIFIPTLPHLENKIRNYTNHWKIKTIILTDKNKIENYFLSSKFALVCSGTASLEIAKRNIPQLLIYKLNLLTELILKLLTKIRFANIFNIIENKMIIPELTNSKLNKKKFLIEFSKLINDNRSNNLQISNIKKILPKIYTEIPPYDIAVNRISKYL